MPGPSLGTGDSTVNKWARATNGDLGVGEITGPDPARPSLYMSCEQFGILFKMQVDGLTYEVESMRLGEGLKIIHSAK